MSPGRNMDYSYNVGLVLFKDHLNLNKKMTPGKTNLILGL